MKYLFLSLISALVFFSACSQDIKSSQKYKDVMAIHDKVMPEMSTLSNLRGEFKAYADSTNLDKIRDVNSKIMEANDNMMQWMNDFKLPETKSEADTYLDSELVKITDISNRMMTAKTNASSLLNELKAAKGK